MALARPVSSSPARMTRTCWPSVAQPPPHLVGQGPSARPLFEQGTPGFEGAEETVEEDQAVHRLRHVVQAGATRRQGARARPH